MTSMEDFIPRNWEKSEAEKQREAWKFIEDLAKKATEEVEALKSQIKNQEKILGEQNNVVVLLNDIVAMLKDVATKQDHNADLLFQLLQKKKAVTDKENEVLDELNQYLKKWV